MAKQEWQYAPELKKEFIVPDPGTVDAIFLGCTCPVEDNDYGRGYHGHKGIFIYNEECPCHGE